MSRLLMAASSKFFRDNQYMNLSRKYAAGQAKKPPGPPGASGSPSPPGPTSPPTPPKAPTSPKCPGDEKNEPLKPGFFPSGGTHAVFSDLPQPEGDFMEHWNARNSKYSLVLYTGLAALIGSIALVVSSGAMKLYFFVPDYPYTEEELEEFEKEKERKQEEKEEREERHQQLIESKELSIRRRHAKDDMAREVLLMQKDIDEGISDVEMTELQELIVKREEFEKWEAAELKRQEEVAKEKEKIRKEKEKARQQQEKEKEKARKIQEKEQEKARKIKEKEQEKERKRKEKAG